MNSLDKVLSEKIAAMQESKLLRTLKTTERLKSAKVIRNGKKLISFSCNDYLGLALDKRVKKAAIAATKKYGTGAGASRLITGNQPLYDILESKIAKICGTESALVFGSGYMANLGAITTLVGSGDIIITDKLAHSCIIKGAKLSGAEFKRFPHNNIEQLAAMLEKYRHEYKSCLIVTEGVFSMDGDSPDMPALQEICHKYGAWLMVDNAHDLKHPIHGENTIIMGTLSKAVGSYGGYIAGSKILIDYLKTTAKTLIYTTGLPPAILGASVKALDIIEKEQWRVNKALENAAYFRETISKEIDGLEMGSSVSQIVPLMIGSIEETEKISQYLYDNGFLVSAIKPPTVPVNTSRLRFSFSAEHDKKDIDRLIATLTRFYIK